MRYSASEKLEIIELVEHKPGLHPDEGRRPLR
jgi:hypothetical protein